MHRLHRICGVQFGPSLDSGRCMERMWVDSLSFCLHVHVRNHRNNLFSIYLFIRGVGKPVIITSIGCPLQIVNNELMIPLAVPIFFESMALGLLLMKSIAHARSLKIFDRSLSRPNILSVMAQDGIGYFSCTVAITTTNLIVLKHVAPVLQDFLLVTQGAMQNILCSRLLFHVRTVNDPSVDTPLGGQTSCMSLPTIAFRTGHHDCGEGCSTANTIETM